MTNQDFIDSKPGLSMLHAHLDGLVARTEANVYWKDLRGKYLDANDWQVTRCGAQSRNELIGATDQDLSWKEFASILMQNDREIVSCKRATIFIEPVMVLDSKQSYLSYKSPLLNRGGKIIGIFGLSYLLKDESNNSHILDEISLIAGKQGEELTRKLLFKKQLSTLTKRQFDCIRLLTKGMTMKQIAEALSLSNRTVEHYLEAAKEKMNCRSKTELIIKVIDLGL